MEQNIDTQTCDVPEQVNFKYSHKNKNKKNPNYKTPPKPKFIVKLIVTAICRSSNSAFYVNIFSEI